MTNTELFGETPPDSKYANWDIEALRKKADAADNHIRTLEAEAVTRRGADQTQATLEELLKKLDTVNQTPANFNQTPPNPGDVRTSTQGEQLSKQDVLSILEQKQKDLEAKANVATVKRELQKHWGNDHHLKLAERSKQLNVPQDFLASMAETHPDAFLRLVLEPASTSNPNVHVPPTTTIRTKDGLKPFVGEKMKDYIQAMRDNPTLRNDANFKTRMQEAAEAQGESFFN